MRDDNRQPENNPTGSLTADEQTHLREFLVRRHFEVAEERQLASDLNLLAALRLGASLRRIEEK